MMKFTESVVTWPGGQVALIARIRSIMFCGYDPADATKSTLTQK